MTSISAKQFSASLRRYFSGATLKEAALHSGMSYEGFYNRMRREGIARKSHSVTHTRLSVNGAAFSSTTDAAAYWVGFLMADGAVLRSAGHSPSVRIALAARDVQHLYRFRSFLGSTHHVSFYVNRSQYGSTRMCYFQVHSAPLAADLARFGVVPNKSLTARVRLLGGNRDFWRGVVDGDGWISFSKVGHPSLGLCGSVPLVRQFITFLRRHGIHATLQKRGRICQTSVVCSQAVRAIRLLYKDAVVALPRKAKRALRASSWCRNYAHKLTAATARGIRTDVARGMHTRVAAAKYSVSKGTIYHVTHGLSWQTEWPQKVA